MLQEHRCHGAMLYAFACHSYHKDGWDVCELSPIGCPWLTSKVAPALASVEEDW